MSQDRSTKGGILWWKGILNGIIAWVIGFAILMLPGLVVAFRMGFDLGPKIKDSAAVGAEISRTVSSLYHGSTAIALGYPIVLAVLVLWRSRRLGKGSPGASTVTGGLVGAFPAVMSLLFYMFGMGGTLSFLEAIVYVVIGVIGFRLVPQRADGAPQ